MSTKIELGCGKSKAQGFIGIDRFQLPGVDIVANLDEGIPLESNTVDVVYASHSLEHLKDLTAIMREIYRVCKNEAIVIVIAPYANTFGDMANPYHTIPFNEHTFRFFTKHYEFLTRQGELELPSLYGRWGLAESDNSSSDMDFRTLDMKFVYFEEYNGLSDEIKTLLRQNLTNVCNMIIYSLCVKKDDNKITTQEYLAFKQQADSIIASLPISALINHWEGITSSRKTFYSHIEEMIRSAGDSCKYNDLQNDVQLTLALHKHELWIDGIRSGLSLHTYLQNQHSKFFFALTAEKKQTQFTFSNALNADIYQEYSLCNRGHKKLQFFIATPFETELTIEFVYQGKIAKHYSMEIEKTGIFSVDVEKYNGIFWIRLDSKVNIGVRVLEIKRWNWRKRAYKCELACNWA